MNTVKVNKKHRLLKGLLITLFVIVTLAIGIFFLLMTHTQIIVGAIQNLSQGTVNTKNLYEPLHEPMQTTKDNGQFIITEIRYSDDYPNSFLDITYPDENVDVQRPTMIYFHGGGFFGGSKCDGDPLAESDTTSLLDDICSEGFNLVNIDYALVPEYHFPTPVIQANEAFLFLMDHTEEYHLNMEQIVIMGSSAGAIITSQIGSVITNPEYAALLGINPALKPEQVKALVIDDAPLDYDKFSFETKILVGNYVKGSIFLSKEEVKKYNNTMWITEDYIPSVLLGSEYYVDMREMDTALENAGVEHELIDPLAEVNIQMPHCFVANERVDETAKDAYNRMITVMFLPYSSVRNSAGRLSVSVLFFASLPYMSILSGSPFSAFPKAVPPFPPAPGAFPLTPQAIGSPTIASIFFLNLSPNRGLQQLLFFIFCRRCRQVTIFTKLRPRIHAICSIDDSKVQVCYFQIRDTVLSDHFLPVSSNPSIPAVCYVPFFA